MSDHLDPTQFSDRDRRWLTHLIGALHNLVEDEILFAGHAYHDPQLLDDPDRFVRLATSGHALIAAGMEHTHAEEAAHMRAEIDAYSAAELAKLVQLPASAEEDR